MAEGQARIATNFNEREVEEIAERIQPNTAGLPNTDVSVEAPPRPSGSGQNFSSGSPQPSTANSEQAVPIESSSVESTSAEVRSWFFAWLVANFVFVISNVVFLAAVFIRSTWLVIYARLLGILVGLFLCLVVGLSCGRDSFPLSPGRAWPSLSLSLAP